MNFYDRLYLGFEGEYFVLSHLFGAGFEGFKLPGDFGFDIIATDQKIQTFNTNLVSRYFNAPYPIQVKSRRVNEDDFYEGPNERPCLDAEFLIKEEELFLLEDTPNSAIAFVCFINTGTIEFFYLPAYQIRDLIEKGYVWFSYSEKYVNYFKVSLTIRYPPMQNRDVLLESLNLDSETFSILQRELPEKINRNWKATKRLYLNDLNLRGKLIPQELLSMKYLGVELISHF